MEDKEVGDLWKRTIGTKERVHDQTVYLIEHLQDNEGLIRKLVEDVAELEFLILKRFGIDPETWT